eukprot:4162499-Pyramimonas_sp.AAC.1
MFRGGVTIASHWQVGSVTQSSYWQVGGVTIASHRLLSLSSSTRPLVVNLYVGLGRGSKGGLEGVVTLVKPACLEGV